MLSSSFSQNLQAVIKCIVRDILQYDKNIFEGNFMFLRFIRQKTKIDVELGISL